MPRRRRRCPRWRSRTGPGCVAKVPSPPIRRRPCTTACFSNRKGGAEIAEEMKARRRERATLDALDELVAHLDRAGGPRTVVLVVSEGLAPVRREREPDRESHVPAVASPRRLAASVAATGRPAPVSGVSQVECEADLRALARMDHTQRLRGLADAANGALVTFVPVTGEALGAPADPSLGSGPRPEGDRASAARARDAQVDSLRFIADNTGGAALTVPGERGGLATRLESEHAPYYLVAYRPTSCHAGRPVPHLVRAYDASGRAAACAPRVSRPDRRGPAERSRGAAPRPGGRRRDTRGAGHSGRAQLPQLPVQHSHRGLGEPQRRLVLDRGRAGRCACGANWSGPRT